MFKACIFDIQPYSIHDGPGIRTTVFFKGCPLRCLWCHNPESNNVYPQLMYYSAKCRGCGRCIDLCPVQAIYLSAESKKVKTDRTRCTNCGACTNACLYRAREMTGKMLDVDEVFEQVMSDRMFFETSGGGITASGGEPLCVPSFIRALFEKCKREGIHTAIETCGYGSWEAVREAMLYTDLVLYDLKAMDSKLHKELTGVDNGQILENCIRIKRQLHKAMVVRIPVVPGLNDSRENLISTADFIKRELGADVPVHLLPYHSLGDSKLESLESGKCRLDILPPGEEQMNDLKKLMSDTGLNVQVGAAM